ncbi:ATP-dependent DNA helicase UvrD2 [Nakamurella endophytica]|uniref:DNA 3'-5' helicase n=1 Tax=Nakamurella endophytica TaxID=1748367 RepID=A0A917T2C2_9ACTN|nr:ATP-dependent DNA helicase UvrD2 [Nakamurella endophytica]GGM07928.1 DNA helicase [Nakamurella endophytica]
MSAELLAGLDEGQRLAVQAPSGPVCVLAGAGTGKTRTITHRIARLVATGAHPVSEILAVTFTTRAAGEMRSRLRGLGVPGAQARTFHSAALKQLRYFWPRSVGGPLWPVLEQKMRLVAMASRRVGAGTDTATLRDLAGEIEWAKASLVAPDDYVAAAGRHHRDTPVAAELAARVFAGYEELKRESEQLDFDDLLLHTCAVLEDDEDVAREFRARYRCFVVDEYQDVTPLQQRLLDAWLGGRDQLTVVGDANQTIYSFAGASPTYLLGFASRYPEATVVKLERDYRSTPQVVTVANQVIAGAQGRAARLRLRLTAALPPGPPVRYTEHPDEPTEARAVAEQAAALIAGGMPASEIAVLYRINAQSEAYEQSMAAAGVPYVVRGGERFFARPEVRQAMVAVRRAAAPADAPGAEPVDLVTAVREVLVPVGLTAEPPPAGSLRERWDNLLALVSLAEEVAAAVPGAGLADLAAELEQRAEAQHAPTVDGVTLASLHAAKGLEWDAVFLVGLSEGTLPIQHAETPDEIEEERRLLYVGVTRARTRLAVSWSLSRSEGGRRTRRRSRFLTGIAPESSVPSRAARSGRCRVCGGPLTDATQAKLGRCEQCPSNADPDLVDALRDWRRRRSGEAGVPAYVVFSDATLLAIAERRPADDAALLAIPGIGRSKLDAYGRDVLSVVSATD